MGVAQSRQARPALEQLVIPVQERDRYTFEKRHTVTYFDISRDVYGWIRNGNPDDWVEITVTAFWDPDWRPCFG